MEEERKKGSGVERREIEGEEKRKEEKEQGWRRW